MSPDYQCLGCRQSRWRAGEESRICDVCGAVVPEIEGVAIFLERPAAALRAYAADFAGLEAQLEETRRALEELSAKLPPQLSRRGAQQRDALHHNLRLMRNVVEPVLARAAHAPAEADLFSWISVQTGLSFQDMLVYFYEDWWGTAEFGVARELLRNAIGDHAASRRKVAVLGAAACGMAHALASEFDCAYAVDLALPTLLLARRLMAGQRLAVHVPGGSWPRIELTPPPPARGRIELLAANVMNLPFPDASLSAVVTQCLLNVAGNPLQLAEEIRRVLEPGGIWLNFSHAFQVPEDPAELGPRRLEELPPLLRALGFDELAFSRSRFAMLDLRPVDPDAVATEEAVQFFVVRRSHQPAVGAPFQQLRRQFESRDAALWEERPALIPGRPLSLSTRRSFGGDADGVEHVLGVGGVSLAIPEPFASTLGALLERTDGERSLRELFDALRLEQLELSEDAFLELMQCLSLGRYLIEFPSTRCAAP